MMNGLRTSDASYVMRLGDTGSKTRQQWYNDLAGGSGHSCRPLFAVADCTAPSFKCHRREVGEGNDGSFGLSVLKQTQ